MKPGFAYYNTDTDRYQDIKIKRLKKSFGRDGVAVYDYILCEIYRVKGCFIEWDESTAFDVADYWGMNESQVQEIVSYCAVVGLFNKGLLDRGRVLTSSSIQSRYLEMCKRAKRNIKEIPEKYLIHPEKTEKIPEEVTKPPEEIDKVEKSRVKKSRVFRANALVPQERDDGHRLELKSNYKALTSSLMGKEVPEIWTGIKNFIIEHKPDWLEPYADIWNIFSNTYKLPILEALSDSRRKKFNTRLTDPAFDFIRILEKIKRSAHLKGDNSSSWKCTFDWIIENDKNYLKILEGNYD